MLSELLNMKKNSEKQAKKLKHGKTKLDTLRDKNLMNLKLKEISEILKFLKLPEITATKCKDNTMKRMLLRELLAKNTKILNNKRLIQLNYITILSQKKQI